MIFLVISKYLCIIATRNCKIQKMTIEKTFSCDECEKKFSVGQGFLGSLNDFEFQMSDRSAINEDVECSPFMSYVQLCNHCYDNLPLNYIPKLFRSENSF